MCICANQPAAELDRLRQAKLTPDAMNCRAGQGVNLHDGLGSAETQVALPGCWKRYSALSCVICPNVDILLADRALERDGPTESECAAPCQNRRRVTSIPFVYICLSYTRIHARAHVIRYGACNQASSHQTTNTHPERAALPREPRRQPAARRHSDSTCSSKPSASARLSEPRYYRGFGHRRSR